MKRFIAFSGGVESTTMCALYGANATPIFTDTGFEHKPLYAQIKKVQKVLGLVHGPEFIVKIIKAKNVENTGMDTLPDYIRLRKFYPNSVARFCTRLFKIKPMDDFLRDQGPCELLIGLNADEADDREGNYGECKNVTYRYPLLEAGYDRKKCETFLSQIGLKPNSPAHMRRGGCIGCFFKSKKEYEAMALMAPEEAEIVAELEESIQDKRTSHYHIHPQIPNMREFIDQSKRATLFKPEEMYSNDITGKGCGVFCHR